MMKKIKNSLFSEDKNLQTFGHYDGTIWYQFLFAKSWNKHIIAISRMRIVFSYILLKFREMVILELCRRLL